MHTQRKVLFFGVLTVFAFRPLTGLAQDSSGKTGTPDVAAASAQNSSIETELPIVAAAHAAFARDRDLHSVRIEGTVKAHAGRSMNTGTVVMIAYASGANSFDLHMSDGPVLVNQSEMKAGRTCTWSRQDGKVHQIPPFNCWTATTWFMPHLSLLPSSRSMSAVVHAFDTGLNKDATGSYRDMRHQVVLASPRTDAKVTALIRDWSTSDLRLDPVTFLPSKLNFVTHADNNSNININTEIRFDDYRDIDGVELPFHIQRYLNGALELDIEATQITVQ